MYIYHALINALSAHMIHINLKYFTSCEYVHRGSHPCLLSLHTMECERRQSITSGGDDVTVYTYRAQRVVHFLLQFAQAVLVSGQVVQKEGYAGRRVFVSGQEKVETVGVDLVFCQP